MDKDRNKIHKNMKEFNECYRKNSNRKDLIWARENLLRVKTLKEQKK